MAKKTTIRCPKCGCEYLPGEIYYPNHFLGRPEQVFRDEEGNVLGVNGTDMDTTEEYTCDRCGAHFSVDASVTFRTTLIPDLFKDDDEFFDTEKE